MRYAIIVAAGGSSRFGKDKLDELLLGKTVLQHSADVFRAVADEVIVVGRHIDGAVFAEGGATRHLSVVNGLRLIDRGACGTVAVHDGARPFITREFAERLFAEAERYGSAVPTLPVTDTLYGKGDMLPADRNNFFTVQTPQVFDISKLLAAAERAEGDYPDESTLYTAVYGGVHFTEGLRSNVKLTFESDLPDFRTGTGYDVHPFEEGSGVTLGGVTIPFDRKLKGHSDADALCHALCDAILSASGNKDIGHFFPDTDPQYKGIDSTVLLARCVHIAEQSGFETVNASAVVICQAPKIAPHIDKMAARLADILKVASCCVNISATTTERLGALGNGDGVAVEASVLMRRL